MQQCLDSAGIDSMIAINVRHNFPEVQRKLRLLSDDIRDRALAAALNKVADKAKTQAVRAITDEYAIKSSEVRPRITVRGASAKGLRLSAVVEVMPGSRRGRSLNVIHFLERKVTLAEAKRRAKRGTLNQLHFKFRKTGGMKMIPGSFIVTANRGTFVAARVGRTRYPIESKQVIDVPQMFNARKINSRIVATINDQFPVEFDRASAFFLQKFARR